MTLSAPTKPKAQPIHRWENGFELHGLPELPERGVVGLLGGSGKTTALLILAGRLDPSLGWYGLIQRYRGSGLGEIIRRIDAEELQTSYKPQAVERLRHLPDLHRNLGDINLDDDAVHFLELGGYGSKDLEKLSASELQRISIAAALSKRADVYLLDCPSEHLDIFQRRLAARLIKGRGTLAPIIVADNDITFLRWACDSICICYGDEVWGTVSQPYEPKEAVSAFIGGVLPKENIKIREKAHVAEAPEARARRASAPREIMLSFAGVQKRFNGNVVQLDGEICSNEHIGILGRDSSGKTTLMNIIAGKEKFTGLARGKVKAALKPQHISQGALLKGMPKELLASLGIPLRGRPRLTPSLRQRIAIAKCLNTKADIYVLDQPSDGLTAEERLAVAELLRSKPNVVVSDHDAWLVAHVADRCGVVVRTDGRTRVEWTSVDDAMEKVSQADNAD